MVIQPSRAVTAAIDRARNPPQTVRLETKHIVESQRFAQLWFDWPCQIFLPGTTCILIKLVPNVLHVVEGLNVFT